MAYDRQKEIREARAAGEQALDCLLSARDLLASARNWGVMDMLGGGLISGIMKHSKIEKAEMQIERARQAVRTFRKELSDIPDIGRLSVDIGEFMRFADFFFDGFFVDFMVQSRIRDAQSQVDDAIHKVRQVLTRLNSL